MTVNAKRENNTVTLEVEGRLDATTASVLEKKINDECETAEGLILDFKNLAYISSAGLRVVLKLRKEEPKLAIINVSPEVYEIFDMTGFTDMITIEKAYRRMSVDGCEFIAKGANGAVYRYDA